MYVVLGRNYKHITSPDGIATALIIILAVVGVGHGGVSPVAVGRFILHP